MDAYFLIKFLGDFDKPTAIDFAIPLQFPQLATQLKQGGQKVLNLFRVKTVASIQGLAIPFL